MTISTKYNNPAPCKLNKPYIGIFERTSELKKLNILLTIKALAIVVNTRCLQILENI